MNKASLIRSLTAWTNILFFLLFSTYGCANPPLWTVSGSRLQLISTHDSSNINWLFLPGGPGLGSEYLRSFALSLELPGNTWLVDLPGDGSNRITKTIDFNTWPAALTEAVSSLNNVILVSHSFAGMITLSTPQLQDHLIGLILMNTSPSSEWMQASKELAKQKNLPVQTEALEAYQSHKTDESFRNFTIAMSSYFFSKDDIKEGKKLLQNLPFNHVPYDWAILNFNPHYQATWVPLNIPTLIIGGGEDILTPINLFEKTKEFKKQNIKIVVIPRANHFSWFGNQIEMKKIFTDFYNTKIRIKR